MAYTFFRISKFDNLEEFDTIIIQVVYRTALNKHLEQLSNEGFQQDFDNEYLEQIMLDLMSEYNKALIINKKNMTYDIFNYNHVVGELSGTPFYWSKEKIDNMGKIALVENIQF